LLTLGYSEFLIKTPKIKNIGLTLYKVVAYIKKQQQLIFILNKKLQK